MIYSNYHNFSGKSNPKRLKFITLSSPKADRRLVRPEAAEDTAWDGHKDEEEEGVEPMETDSVDLNLVLEETQEVDTFSSGISEFMFGDCENLKCSF